MSLKFAILTSLTEREGSGIELARRFDRSIGYFWPATHQQIYRELDRLGTAGLIRELPLGGAPSRGNPRRFGVTAEGAQVLGEWTRDIDEPEPMRSTIAVRVRAAAATGRTHEVRHAVEHHRAQREAALREYRVIEERDFGEPHANDPQRELQYLVLRLGIQLEQGWLDWCDQVLEALHHLPRQ